MQRKIVVISHQHDTNIARNFFRCNCGSCSTEKLVQAKETRCCAEISNCVDALVLAGSQNTCITDHPAFDAICLNRWSLELASDRFKTRSGQRYQQVESKDRLVHIIHVMCCHFSAAILCNHSINTKIYSVGMLKVYMSVLRPVYTTLNLWHGTDEIGTRTHFIRAWTM